MNPIIRNILAVIAGIFIGSIVNMGIIQISSSIIPPPEGVDLTTSEGLKSSMHLLKVQHFIFPFLAHALGTFVGAVLTTFIAVGHKLKMALVVGTFFLMGGITVTIFMIPSPLWYTLIDLIFAYIPMAYIAGRMMNKNNSIK